MSDDRWCGSGGNPGAEKELGGDGDGRRHPHANPLLSPNVAL